MHLVITPQQIHVYKMTLVEPGRLSCVFKGWNITVEAEDRKNKIQFLADMGY